MLPKLITRACVAVLLSMSCASGTYAADTTQSSPSPQPLLTRHVPEAVRSGHVQSHGSMSGTQIMHFDITLPPRDQAGVINFLNDVYNPASPAYHHFLTPTEFSARFGPTLADYNALVQHLQARGITVTGGSHLRSNVVAQASVATIEAAFHIKMLNYQHPYENRSFHSPDREPTIDLGINVMHISGLDNYAIPKPLYQQRPISTAPNAVIPLAVSNGSCPGGGYCGTDMRAAYYGTGAGATLTGAGQSVGLLEYLGYNIADLNAYYTNAHVTAPSQIPATPPPVINGISTDGSSVSCNYPSCDDAEQILDMTQVLGMAPNITQLNVYVGNTDTAILSSMATYIGKTGNVDMQLSFSWTWVSTDQATDDQFFQQMAAQGQSVFTASGDQGSYLNVDTTVNPTAPSSTLYDWVFPANDPYLTVVGGTNLVAASANGPWSSEVAWQYGGGGFHFNNGTDAFGYGTTDYAIPAWQQFANVIGNGASSAYRNSPDVSGESNFDFYVCRNQAGCVVGYGGTSFAAPMWAGFMALVNQQRFQTTQNVGVGFINPAIYALGSAGGARYAAAFHDITSGSNTGYGSKGYAAASGYDLATGWGSPTANLITTLNALAGTPTLPNFRVSGGAVLPTVVQGLSASTTLITTYEYGFAGPVTLSATGQPAGVTVSFNPSVNTSTGATTPMQVAVSPAAAPGNYTFTVNATGGNVQHSVAINLTVAAARFTLNAATSQASVKLGRQTAIPISLSAIVGVLSKPIQLSVKALPPGVTANFSPAALAGAGVSTLTLSASPNATKGHKTVTVNATSGASTAQTQLRLSVQP